MVTAGRKYLLPEVLNKLKNLELVAKCAVQGFYAGLHPSPFHGFSVEYSDHRQYERGDELRFIDWKMYGRSDKLYVKQFLQETNTSVHILLDASASMTFAEGGVTKLEYGAMLAASLAYLMIEQSDAVGLVTFAERILTKVPPRSRRTHLHALLTTLAGTKGQGRTNLAKVLHTFAETTTRRGIVILISDLVDDEDDLTKGLAHLKYLGNDVILFHVLDHQELQLDYEGLVEFEDLETGARLRTYPKSLREAYLERLGAFMDEVQKTAGSSGIDYCALDTSEPLDKAFLAYLARRKRSL